MDAISVNNVSFSYFTGHDILKNISINIKQGEFVCIVGENGSGKSTLIKCILGLNKVLFPEPFSPTIQVKLPLLTFKSIFFKVSFLVG